MSENTNPMRKPRQKPPRDEANPTEEGPQPASPPAPGVSDPATRTPTDRNWPPRTGPLFLLILVLPVVLAGGACTAPALLLQREVQTAARAAQARPADPKAKPCLDAAKAADGLLHQSYPLVTRAGDDAVYHMRELCRSLIEAAPAPTDGGSHHG